jgi:hypothetical protein
VVRFAYEEVAKNSRLMALEGVLDAARLGAPLRHMEKAIVLKMTEDMEGEVADAAWKIAARLLNKGGLGSAQMEYLAKRGETGEDGAASMAGLRLRLAKKVEDVDEMMGLMNGAEEAFWVAESIGMEEVELLGEFMCHGNMLVAGKARGIVLHLLEEGVLDRGKAEVLMEKAEGIGNMFERGRVIAKLKALVPDAGDSQALGRVTLRKATPDSLRNGGAAEAQIENGKVKG